MKTVRIIEYHVFGTRNVGCTSLMYRGKTVQSFTGPGSHVEYKARRRQALTWAAQNGFTHYQLGEDTLKRNHIITPDPAHI